MIRLKLGNRDLWAVVDDEDEFVSSFRWRGIPHRSSGNWYAARTEHWYEKDGTHHSSTIYLHRQLMAAQLNNALTVDHKDGDGLNNHKSNLEVVTYAENNRRAADRRNAAIRAHWAKQRA